VIRIVDRYLAKEAALTVAGVTGVLMLILLSNRFAVLLGDAAAGRLPRDTVFTLLGLASINYFIVVLPVSLFLAVMLALGRLYRDSEMTTLMACGVGPAQIYRPLLAIAALIAVGLAILSLQVAPWAQRMTRVINTAAQHNAQVGSFESGSFKVDEEGRGALYAQKVSTDGTTLQDVFIQAPSDDRMAVITAATGQRQGTELDPGGGMLILKDGWRYEGIPGHADYRVVRFQEHGIVIQPARALSGTDYFDEYPTSELMAVPNLKAVSELQWRLSVPLSAIVLVLLAVPLARTSPRQGRYGKLVAAILVYVIYYNLGVLARAWLEKGSAPPQVGIWWVDVLFAVVVLAMLVQQYGFEALFGAGKAGHA